MDTGNPYDPALWIARGRAIVSAARDGKVPDIELAIDVKGWPDTWVAAELLTHDLGTDRAIDVEMVLNARNPIAVKPVGDVDALLERGDLEGAWRASFAPELADAIEALDAATPVAPIKEPKKKSELEAAWRAAAPALSPKSLFAGTWPSKWKDALRRTSTLCTRPRSPLLAAAAIEFAKRDDLPYTSIGAQTFWKAFAWFIAEQCDVRQLPALEALEKRIAEFVGGDNRFAAAALRDFKPRELSAKTRAMIEKLAIAKPVKSEALSLASAEERGVAADQLLQAGDPRGEFIVVQERIAAGEPTDELLKTQSKLLKKHAKAWCPPMIYRDSCVFRGGVPVAGHLLYRSDSELRSFVGSKALATFEMLIVDDATAMGPVNPATIAAVVQSLPVRTVVTTDAGAGAIAFAASTSIEHISVPGGHPVMFGGPGLAKLRRIDGDEVREIWLKWFPSIEEVGCTDVAQWDELWRSRTHAVVLCDRTVLHKRSPDEDTEWELVAKRGKKAATITARPLPGSTAESLARTLARVTSWKGVDALYVPKNFVDGVKAKVPIKPIAVIDPASLGTALCFL